MISATTLAIHALWQQCLHQERTDKEIVQALRKVPAAEMVPALRDFITEKQIRGDDLILFNWFIGNTFNICINELKCDQKKN